MRPASRARASRGVGGGVVDELGVGGVTEAGVVVESDLAVQGDDAAVGGLDQGVDLHEGGVLGGEDLPEALDDGGDLVGQGPGLKAGGLNDPVGDLGGDALERVDADAGQGLGALGREGLDVHAALARAHRQVLALGAVQEDGEVVLGVEVDAVGDEDGAHRVALDVHAQDVAGAGFGLLNGAGELDAAGLAAAAGLDLGLDDHQLATRVEEGLRGAARLLGGRGHGAVEHGDAVLAKQVPGLVLVEIHAADPLGACGWLVGAGRRRPGGHRY